MTDPTTNTTIRTSENSPSRDTHVSRTEGSEPSTGRRGDPMFNAIAFMPIVISTPRLHTFQGPPASPVRVERR